MKFSTALVLAIAVHALGIVLLWRGWPPPPPPAGEVVPLELRAAEPPSAPPPEGPPAPPAVAEPAGGKPGRRPLRPQTVVALQPEPAGEVPVGSPAPQTAAATGSTTGSGAATGAPTGTATGTPTGRGTGTATGIGVDHAPLKAQAMERIRAQRHYPELARRRRIEGTVIVAFRVQPDGAVMGARIKQSVDEMLDQAALEAVKKAAPLPGALSSDGELEVLLQFGLTP